VFCLHGYDDMLTPRLIFKLIQDRLQLALTDHYTCPAIPALNTHTSYIHIRLTWRSSDALFN